MERHICPTSLFQRGKHRGQAQIALFKFAHGGQYLLGGGVIAQRLQLLRKLRKLVGMGGVVVDHILHQRQRLLHRVAAVTGAALVGAIVAVPMLRQLAVGMGMGMVAAVVNVRMDVLVRMLNTVVRVCVNVDVRMLAVLVKVNVILHHSDCSLLRVFFIIPSLLGLVNPQKHGRFFVRRPLSNFAALWYNYVGIRKFPCLLHQYYKEVVRMLNGKAVIVTGGTRGIGLAIVRTFLQNGARVALFGSRQETADRAVAALKAENSAWSVMGLAPDLTDFDAVRQAVDEVCAAFGGVDVLVNNAGISAREPLAEYRPEDFKKIMDLNVTAVFNGCKAVEPIMRAAGHGCIINTSSMVSLYGQPAGVGYPTSKFAVNGLTKSLARELGPAGIRVNAVAPGVTRTDMVAALPKEMVERISAPIPLRRIGEPQEVANVFLFLASDLASYVTGTVVSVDGAAQT